MSISAVPNTAILSGPAPAPPRHALGMPGGSIRSILALLVVALFCGVLLFPSGAEGPQAIPPYLVYLIFLILGHLFASHRHVVPGHPAPLYLPRFLVRLAIIAALAGTLGWKIYSDPDGMQTRWNATVELLKDQAYLPILLLGAFFIGAILHPLIGRDNAPIAVQDLQGWLALISVLTLVVAGIIHLVIEQSTSRPISHPTWESYVAVVIACYFGVRA
jgi:hypothetical protein